MKAALVASALCALTVSATAGEIELARGLCTGLAMMTDFSKPCDVNGWGPSVDVWVDMTGAQAAEYCRVVVGIVAEAGLKLSGWELRIYSPFSGENTIGYCKLTPD